MTTWPRQVSVEHQLYMWIRLSPKNIVSKTFFLDKLYVIVPENLCLTLQFFILQLLLNHMVTVVVVLFAYLSNLIKLHLHSPNEEYLSGKLLKDNT